MAVAGGEVGQGWRDVEEAGGAAAVDGDAAAVGGNAGIVLRASA